MPAAGEAEIEEAGRCRPEQGGARAPQLGIPDGAPRRPDQRRHIAHDGAYQRIAADLEARRCPPEGRAQAV